MGPATQTLSAWLVLLVGWMIAVAGAIAIFDPGTDTAIMALVLLIAVAGLAILRPFEAAYVPVTVVAVLAYVTVQALRASNAGPNGALLYLPAASVGALGIVAAAIMADQVRRHIGGLDEELIARGRVIEELQLIDPATGAYRRPHGYRMIEEEIERGQRYATDFSLALLSADNWDQVQDLRGPEGAQELMVRLAHRYAESLRASDRLIHFGGGEFLVLLVETGMDTAQAVAEKLCEAAEDVIPVPVRAGVSSFPTSEVTASGLIAEAQSALEFARAARVPVAGPDLLA
ncbi:MAG: GGDEF domain-containing protein [Dehalococcoidia bacterium]